MWKVYVRDVDGTHFIGQDKIEEEARKIALDWLGSNYNETGKNHWVGMYGSVVYIEQVDHPTGLFFFEWTKEKYGYDDVDYNCNDEIKESQWKKWLAEYEQLKENPNDQRPIQSE